MFWERKQDKRDLLEELYRLYEHKMYAIAFAVLHSREQAEDVVQDSFVKLVPYLSQIKAAESAGTKQLVMRIVKTTAIDQYRKNLRDAVKISAEEIMVGDCNKKVLSIQSVEDRETIKALLEGLPDDYREVIKLRCYYGFSAKETAEILQISPHNVAKKLERARKMILSKLEWEEFDYEQKKTGTGIGTVRSGNRETTV